MITYEEVRHLFDYDEFTGLFTWSVSLPNNVNKGDNVGTKTNGYLQAAINGKKYMVHVLIWFWYHGYYPENQIDHRDRIRHHNWILNLREVSGQCNQRNASTRKDNTSGVKGVCRQNGKWKAQLYIKSKPIYLGTFEDFTEAVCHRLAGEQCLNWAGCDSNSPAYQYIRNFG